MEAKFIQNTLHCLRTVISQVHTGEQTQEIRLPDAYPDIGKILGCWGQVLIRGKEWRGNGLGANGGVMAFVLYAPEDGTQPRVVDAWIPIQCRWEIPDDSEDGVMHLLPKLSNLDCRGISARKIMVRATVDTFAQGLNRQSVNIAAPGQLPEDVQLLKRNYPVELPMEAGEKQVQIEERLSLPGDLPPIHKLIQYNLSPGISEQKVIGNRLVFRGQSELDLLYMTEDGEFHSWQTELPFSQFTELDRDYSHQAAAWVLPVLTAMEMDLTDGELNLRGGIAAQYTIFDQEMLELVEDAFSPYRSIRITTEQLQLPMLLDRVELEIPVEASVETDAEKVISGTVFGTYPFLVTKSEAMEMDVDGHLQIVGENAQGLPTGESGRFSVSVPYATAGENQNILWAGTMPQPEFVTSGDRVTFKGKYPVSVYVYSTGTIPMITELEMGELREQDPSRPSLILRRAGQESLWDLAKNYGSTIDAIQKANQLTGEPVSGKMLLIPVC